VDPGLLVVMMVAGALLKRPVRDPVRWRLLLRGLLRTSPGSADLDRSHESDREIAHGFWGIKPGWARESLNYFISAPLG